MVGVDGLGCGTWWWHLLSLSHPCASFLAAERVRLIYYAEDLRQSLSQATPANRPSVDGNTETRPRTAGSARTADTS